MSVAEPGKCSVQEINSKRKRFMYLDRPIYDWEQSLTDLEVFIVPPVSEGLMGGCRHL